MRFGGHIFRAFASPERVNRARLLSDVRDVLPKFLKMEEEKEKMGPNTTVYIYDHARALYVRQKSLLYT